MDSHDETERAERLASTRASWNRATNNHNRHKGDQAAFLRDGGSTLFREELELLGDLAGKRLVHVQCNAGQDSLSLARRGAEVLGVDFSDEAVAFARKLSEDSGIPARFELAEAVSWMAGTDERFDVAFASYGVTGWIEDLQAWADGVARILRPGGRFVYVEFHPLCWSLDAELNLRGDDYFQDVPFVEPVGDYVAESETGLGGSGELTAGENDIPATSWQHTLGDLVTAFSRAGLQIERLREYPYVNGCRLHAGLVWGDDRRWRFPEGVAQVPLMFGLACVKPA
jgi:SAM-dependent methyltransferase